MPKNRSMGGAGGKDSTQQFYLSGIKRYYNPGQKNYVLSKKELASYFIGEQIECLECGNWYRSLTKHLGCCHKMTTDEYCIYHGIPMGATLNSEGSSNKMSFSAKERDDWDQMMQRAKTNLAVGHKLLKEAHILRELQCPDCFVKYKRLSNKMAPKNVICPKCRKDKNIRATRASKEKYLHKEIYDCNFCKKGFETQNDSSHRKVKTGDPVYCSLSCASSFNNTGRKRVQTIKQKEALRKYREAREPVSYTKECPQCKKSFTRSRNKYTYCGLECYKLSGKALEYAIKNGALGGKKRAATGARDKSGKFIKPS